MTNTATTTTDTSYKDYHTHSPVIVTMTEDLGVPLNSIPGYEATLAYVAGGLEAMLKESFPETQSFMSKAYLHALSTTTIYFGFPNPNKASRVFGTTYTKDSGPFGDHTLDYPSKAYFESYIVFRDATPAMPYVIHEFVHVLFNAMYAEGWAFATEDQRKVFPGEEFYAYSVQYASSGMKPLEILKRLTSDGHLAYKDVL